MRPTDPTPEQVARWDAHRARRGVAGPKGPRAPRTRPSSMSRKFPSRPFPPTYMDADGIIRPDKRVPWVADPLTGD